MRTAGNACWHCLQTLPSGIARKYCQQQAAWRWSFQALHFWKIFLCYSTKRNQEKKSRSAKAEIFLCHSTFLPYQTYHYLQKQKFSCATQLIAVRNVLYYLQKQKFSCVTQQTMDDAWITKSAKAEIFLCYSTKLGTTNRPHLQKQKFSCVTQHMWYNEDYDICKSRNFLVLLNENRTHVSAVSAKAEIFLCYSTFCIIFRSISYLQKQKFSCVTQHLLRHYAQISTE